MSEQTRPEKPSPTPEAVRAYYDQFTAARTVQYTQHGNLRIEKAIGRIVPYVQVDSQVLEIGCGLGLVAEQLARVAQSGSVWACDISEQAVQVARQRVQAAHVQFRAIDVLRRFDELRTWVPVPIQLIAMVDVLEHCPLGEHSTLFQNLRSILAEGGHLVLTFPSPQYQRYLREANPEELQIIDEVIELAHIQTLAAEARFGLKHFSLEDVWLQNQYVHCVLTPSTAIRPLGDPQLQLAIRELAALIPSRETVVLVDESQWAGQGVLPGCRSIPFLERDGEYWGPPPDDETAIRECERLRQTGARFIVFGWPAFWWLDYYTGFHRHLRASFPCLLDNDRLVVFDLE